jgi:DNA-binding MarR family transcriptional regulator
MSYKKLAKNVTDPSLAAWCAALAEPCIAAEAVPAGWFTVADLADEMKRDRSTVSQRMRDMVKRDKAEMSRFRIVTGRGVYPVPHYKLK